MKRGLAGAIDTGAGGVKSWRGNELSNSQLKMHAFFQLLSRALISPETHL